MLVHVQKLFAKQLHDANRATTENGLATAKQLLKLKNTVHLDITKFQIVYSLDEAMYEVKESRSKLRIHITPLAITYNTAH